MLLQSFLTHTKNKYFHYRIAKELKREWRDEKYYWRILISYGSVSEFSLGNSKVIEKILLPYLNIYIISRNIMYRNKGCIFFKGFSFSFTRWLLYFIILLLDLPKCFLVFFLCLFPNLYIRKQMFFFIFIFSSFSIFSLV